jgi:hypothetical protein
MKQLHRCTHAWVCAGPSQKPLQWVRPVSATSNRWGAACPSLPRQSCPCKCNRPPAPKSNVLPNLLQLLLQLLQITSKETQHAPLLTARLTAS